MESIRSHVDNLVAQGRTGEAFNALQNAIDAEPARLEFRFALARLFHRLGRNIDARSHYLQLLERWPACGEAHFEISQLHEQLGDRAEARRFLDLALEHPPQDHAMLNRIGIVCTQTGRIEAAIACLERAIELAPQFAAAHNNLGNAFKVCGRLDAAVTAYRNAIQHQPANAEFEMNLGRALQDVGQVGEAMKRYRNAAELAPKRPDPQAALATLSLSRGNNRQAFQAVRKALKVAGKDLSLRVNMANLLQEVGQHAEAEKEYRHVLEIDPQYFAGHSNLAYLLADQGRNPESRAHYDLAIQLAPAESRLKVVAASKLPPIYMSNDEIQQCRQELERKLHSLYEEGVRIDAKREMMPTLFYLAYHGQNDRSLFEQLARLAKSTDRRTDVRCPRHGRRIRIGFLSMNLKQHTIGSLWVNLVAGLSREDFDVRILAASPADDTITRRIRARADNYIDLPRDVEAALRLAEEQELDIVLFPDIGMDPFTYTLAYTRIAPIQCVTWGHPTTTGLDSIDYFLSSEHLETPTSDQFYTEKLIRFRRLMVCYDRPALGSSVRGRSHFRLPENATVYGCPQSLFKFHPDFDHVIRAILESDPRGILVLIEGRYDHWKKMLMQRFQQTLGDLCERIRFVPRASRADYLNLLAVTDVLLDPIHFGGGNTSYEGFAMGVPIVTLPSEYLRARLTFAMYQQMGLDDLVARDIPHYISLAVSLGTKPDFRRAARDKIRSTADCLFGDRTAIQEFEDFVKAAVEAESKSPGTRIDWRPSKV